MPSENFGKYDWDWWYFGVCSSEIFEKYDSNWCNLVAFKFNIYVPDYALQKFLENMIHIGVIWWPFNSVSIKLAKFGGL